METDNIFFIDPQGQVFSGSMCKKFPAISTDIPPMHLSGWVASEWFNFFAAKAPVYRKQVVQKTMPYMMEEYLLEPLDNYHLTIIMSGRTKPVSIYATAHAKMQEWMQLLETINIAPTGLYPDLLALPHDDRYISAYIGPKRSLARTGEYTGFCGKGKLFFSLLEEEAEKHNKAIQILTAKSSLVPKQFQKYVGRDKIEWLDFLSQAQLPNIDANLLHSQYVTKGQSKDDEFKITPFKGVALAASFLLLVLLADVFNIMTYKSQTDEIHVNSKELYQQMFGQEITDISQLRNRVLINLQDIAGESTTDDSDIWRKLKGLADLLRECNNCNLLEFKLTSDSKRVSLIFESREESSNMPDILTSEGWRTLSWKTNKVNTPAGFFKVYTHKAVIENRS